MNEDKTFAITDTKHYIPVATLSTDDNSKLLQQLNSGFKYTIIWNKYEPKTTNRILKTNILIISLYQVFREQIHLLF